MSAQPTDIPGDVLEALKRTIENLRWLSGRVTDICYREDLNRDGLSINLDEQADALELVLQQLAEPTSNAFAKTSA